MKPSVLIIDDHQLFRAGLIELFRQVPNFEVVGEAGDPETGLRLARLIGPDLTILNVELDGQPVTTTIKRLQREASSSRILVLTMQVDKVLERAVLEAGASAFVPKTSSIHDLLRAMRMVWEGTEPSASSRRASSPLTRREAEVLQQLRQARSNKEIAEHLGIAESTVKRHTGSIYQKLGVTSRMTAAVAAQRLGL